MRRFNLKIMKNYKIEITYQETSDIQDFTKIEQQLIFSTIAFAQNAYAPYSNFKVSAGLILENGETLHGTNIENASYPVGICAERTLISYTISNYSKLKINILCVYVDKDLKTPVPPCGMCRQALLEAEQRQESPIQLIMIGKNGTMIRLTRCADLLPLSFDANFLT